MAIEEPTYVSDEAVRATWRALPQAERFRACRLAVVGKQHPDPQVRAAARDWAGAVLSAEPHPWGRRLLGVVDLVLAIAEPLGISDVLDGRPENDANFAVRWYARRIRTLEGVS